MKITNKLVIVIAGLSLGACSSVEEKGTSAITYEELQSEVLSYDEQQTVQPELNEIDGLEVEVAELKNNTVIEAASIEEMAIESEVIDTATIEKMPMEAAAVDTMSDDKNVAMIDVNPVIVPAPILAENASENGLNNSETMMDSKPIEEAPLTIIQPTTATFNYGVQVASYSNRDAALRGWNALLKKDPAAFDGLEPLVNQKEIKGRTMYQLKVGPFLDKPFSENFCKMLKDKGADCFITQYSGDVFTVN